ncbi:hypothetical protein [Rhizobium sp. BK060]|uniref:hypothetical protein n=1 Tax=Rhizobium sp. BK060 TaxID=2587096 RepID=UPI00160BCA9B|nr:hypothetical protein [Rhizobium sp. BK060]MBB3399703.1 hypothetical protein [Rhizobium sp. BK060]
MSTLQLSQADFVARHSELNNRLQAFLLTKRGRQIATKKLKKRLRMSSASSLKAINFVARMQFTEVFSAKLETLLNRRKVKTAFFVTLSLKEHTCPLPQAARFDVTACKAAMRDFLADFSFVGLVEAAYYYHAPFVPGPRRAFVSWHSHAIVWNAEQRELAYRRKRLNRAHSAFVPGWDAAHYRRVTPGAALSYARYVSKSQVNEYTAYPRKREIFDAKTGESTKQPTGKWRNRKRPIRPSNLIRALNVFKERSLKHLTFAGGDGKALRRDILKATRAALHKDAARQTSRRTRLLYGT